METPILSVGILRFGIFEADLRSGELRKNGAKVKIQDLPFRALKLLLSRPNEILSREELRRALWPDDVFVDFDHGISSAINRLRDALGDSAENPIFVETVERKGYRWIAPVHSTVSRLRAQPPVVEEAAEEAPPAPADSATVSAVASKFIWAIPVVALIFAAWIFRPGSHPVRAGAPRGASLAAASGAVPGLHPANPEAEDFYLKGRFYWNKRTPDGLTKALDLFTQSIVHDPSYAKAYVGLADCYNLLREYTMMPANEAYPRALAAAKKAVELDDNSSAAHTSFAFASFYGMWDAATAEREFRRAIELDPKNAIAHHWYATYLMTLGRYPEALIEIDRARALDPSSVAILADKGDILLTAGKSEEAISLLRQMEATDPNFISPHRYLKVAYFAGQDNAEFIAEARQEATLMKDPVGLAIASAAQQGLATGGRNGMLRSMQAAEKKFYDQGKFSAFALAETSARMGDQQAALTYLQAAVEKRDENVVSLQSDAAFQGMRDQPAFRAVLDRVASGAGS
jgi:DNA-binding winged helix-turn-helix (wHTH) protein/tetratricopeptide (TPR) repeat protein